MMKKLLARIAIGLCLIAALHIGSSPAVGQTSTGATNTRSAQVDALLHKLIKPNEPGAALLVIKDGVVVHSRGYGLADRKSKRPFTPQSLSMIGSMSKQFTAMAIMMLAEAGKLNYEDSLKKYSPEFPPYAERITVRHLLHHTAGLPDYEAIMTGPMKISVDTGRSGRDEPSLDDVVKALAARSKPRFNAGEKWEYSNAGYFLLSRIIEKASGERYNDFMIERIFRPLGMTNTFVYDENRLKGVERTVGYHREWYGLKVSDVTPMLQYTVGGGSIFSTLEDLQKWDAALYTEKLVRSSTLQEGLKPGRLNDGTPLNYAFGWEVFESENMKTMLHAGGWRGFKSFICRVPSHRLTIIGLANHSWFDFPAVTREVTKIYLDAPLPLPQ
jgi:CubicO group peptidase (beta-lactamase class C family)